MDKFKQQLKEDFIPRIKEMIKKEENHLDYLKENKKYCPLFKINIDFMIKNSSEMLKHLKTRLKEYIEYSEKIN